MKSIIKTLSIFMATSLLITSCASATMINSNPSGADVYINSEKKGVTPYNYSDTKIVGSTTNITLKKDGFQDFNITLVRNEKADIGAIIGGCFVLVPFLWTMKYDSSRSYELVSNVDKMIENKYNQSSNSTNELIKLQNLVDTKAISKDDFTILKVAILNNEYDYNNSIADQILKLQNLFDKNLLTKDEFNSQKSKLFKK